MKNQLNKEQELQAFEEQLQKQSPAANIHKSRFSKLSIGLGLSVLLAYQAVTWKTEAATFSPNHETVENGLEWVDMNIPEIIEEQPEPEKREEQKPPKVQILTPDDCEDCDDPILDLNPDDTISFTFTPDIPPVDDPIDSPDPLIPVDFAEIPASFIGGNNAFRQYLASHINTNLVKATGARGMVVIYYEVNIDGSIQNVKTIKSLHPRVDQEIMRVFKSMPRWKPASTQGKLVVQRRQLPIPVGPRIRN